MPSTTPKPRKIIHGHRRGGLFSREYNSWRNMLQRCYNEKAPNFKHYGAQGVAVCLQWRTFKQFLEDMGARPEGRSLDRVDPNGHYYPGNCRWATHKEQAANKRQKKD